MNGQATKGQNSRGQNSRGQDSRGQDSRGQDAGDWQKAIRAADTAFFLDVDGTLLGFRDRPEDVVADPGLIDLLERLDAASAGAVALVSGRMICDLDRIMSPLVLPAAGVHGAEIRFADGRCQAFEGEALADIREAAEKFVAEHEGLRLEEKGVATFAIHFRQTPEREDQVARFLDRLVEGHALMVQRGKMVADVKPENCHKGIAITQLMETAPFAGRVPFFVGDDLTDEYGFEAVNGQGGISIKVGADEETTVAHYRLADISNVRSLLELICRSVEG